MCDYNYNGKTYKLVYFSSDDLSERAYYIYCLTNFYFYTIDDQYFYGDKGEEPHLIGDINKLKEFLESYWFDD